MGMFDTVTCSYSLPLPDFTEEQRADIEKAIEGDLDLESFIQDAAWQTKDFDSLLDTYSIEDDGQIYVTETKWIEDETQPNGVRPEEGQLAKFERTAEMNFYQAFLGEKYDHWIEYKAVVFKGEIKELLLEEYKCEDNSDRVKMQEEMEKAMKKSLAKKSGGYRFYRYIFTKPLQIIRAIMGFIIGLTMRIERWIP